MIACHWSPFSSCVLLAAPKTELLVESFNFLVYFLCPRQLVPLAHLEAWFPLKKTAPSWHGFHKGEFKKSPFWDGEPQQLSEDLEKKQSQPYIQVVPGRAGGGSFKRKRTIYQRKNLPIIECAQGDRPARCPNHFLLWTSLLKGSSVHHVPHKPLWPQSFSLWKHLGCTLGSEEVGKHDI